MFVSVCGGPLSGPSGVISVTNVTKYFDVIRQFMKNPPNIEDFKCEWVVEVVRGRNIDVSLTSMVAPSVLAADRAKNRCGNSYVMVMKSYTAWKNS